jgi:MFS transporter, OFA family, oxalate/formate antiporter
MNDGCTPGAQGPFVEAVPSKMPDRWVILSCGTAMLACLGSIYAWSFFTKPLCDTFGWSKMQVSVVFSLGVAALGLSAAYTGPLVSKLGSRRLMFRSAGFFVSGYLIAALGLYLGSGMLGNPNEVAWVSWLSLAVLGLGYGVIGGIGLGTGYVTGVTTIAGWFPDKKGYATGMIVMGFGLGALIMSKVFAPLAVQLAGGHLPLTFLLIGLAFGVITPVLCRFIYSPPTHTAVVRTPTVAESTRHSPHVQMRLWVICFLASLAGLGMLSLLSPLMQGVAAADNPSLGDVELATIGATLIAVASIGNSLGRLFWAWASDSIGRVNAFVALQLSAAVAYLILPHVSSPLLFGALVTYVIASYGGGFGTIPSLISDLYGPKRMSEVHGKILIGWATAGLFAPPLFGYMNDRFTEHAAIYAFYLSAVALLVASAISFSFLKLHNAMTTAPAMVTAADEPVGA